MPKPSKEAVVRFFCIRKKGEPDLYWSPQGEWTNSFLGAAMLTSRQKDGFTLPDAGVFCPAQPGDIKGSFTYSTVTLPKRGTD